MISRRALFKGMVIGMANVGFLVEALSQTSTPAGFESSSDREDPIEIAPGLFLVDYRFDSIASGSIPVFLGEYQNDTGRSFDTPVLGMTFFDAEGNIVGDHYATPVLPVSEDGGRIPVTGEFYEFDPIAEPWDSVVYFACSDLSGSIYLDRARTLDVEIDDLEEDKGDDSYIAKGTVRNNASVPAENIGVYAIFRDERDVFVGYSWTSIDRPVPSQRTIAFSVDINVNSFVPFDPFDRLSGEYSVELILTTFTSGYGINCSSFAPV